MSNVMKVKRGSQTSWEAEDNNGSGFRLAAGQIGYDKTNNTIRIGDGSSQYYSLSAIGGDSESEITIHVGSNSYTSVNGEVYLPGYALEYTTANGYQGFTLNDGSTSNWLRTTVNGLIPYQSGGASSLGTSSWPFNALYANTVNTDTIYGDTEILYNYIEVGTSLKCKISGNDIEFNRPSNYSYFGNLGSGGGIRIYSDLSLQRRLTDGSANYTIWDSGNDGAGSGLDADLLDGYNTSSTDTANTIALRNSSADIYARLFRSTYQNQSTISGAIAYRVSTTDNYIRFCNSTSAIKTYLGITRTTLLSRTVAIGTTYSLNDYINQYKNVTVVLSLNYSSDTSRSVDSVSIPASSITTGSTVYFSGRYGISTTGGDRKAYWIFPTTGQIRVVGGSNTGNGIKLEIFGDKF